jgi:hypothetical protein
MEGGTDLPLAQAFQYGVASDARGQQDEIHVAVVATARWHDLPTQPTARLQPLQEFVVALPDRHPHRRDLLCSVELRVQKGRQDVRWQER